MVIPGFKGMSLKHFGKALTAEVKKDDLSGLASQLAYSTLFAMFPFLIFMLTLLPYLRLDKYVNQLLAKSGNVLPSQVHALVEQFLTGLTRNPKAGLLGVSVLVALWSASRGVIAFMVALNRAYDVKDARNWFHRQGIAVGFVLAGAILGPVLIALYVLGGDAGFWLANRFHFPDVVPRVLNIARWPAAALVVMFGVACLYYFLPDVKQKFKFVTPGSVVATVVWVLASLGLKLYLDTFGKFSTYAKTYGSIAGVIVLLTFLFLTSFIFLLGGEINAVIEHHSAEGKAKGEKVEGEGPPVPESGWVPAHAVYAHPKPRPKAWAPAFVAGVLANLALLKLVSRRARA